MARRVILTVSNDLSMDQRLHRICTTLHTAGYEVTLLGRCYADSPAAGERPYATHRMRMWFRRGKFFYLALQFRLFWTLLFRRCDILCANDLDTLLPVFCVARLRGKALVYDSHEYFTEVPELVARPRTRAVWLWLERRLFPRLRQVITVNDTLAGIYRETYGVPVTAVRNLPFRRPLPVPGPSPAEKLLLYQGAVNAGRGLDLLLAAMVHLPEYRLQVLGGGPELPAMQALAHRLGVAARVDFRGWLPFQDLAAFTATASLGFSLEEDLGANYRLAMPNKMMDYIQAGLPAIVSDLPEMAGLTRALGTGEVLPAAERNGEALAVRIRGLVENAERWEEMAARCREMAGELCWEKEQEKLLAVYAKFSL